MTADKIPTTVAIIMDGNRRFARAKKLPAMKGHELGYEKLKEAVAWAKDLGIETLIVYAFSTENWGRAKGEVGYLMRLLERVVIDRAGELKEKGFHVVFAGELHRFSKNVQEAMKRLDRATAHHPRTLIVALSYGGRAEILDAMKRAVRDRGEKGIQSITESEFSGYLWTAPYPHPDLIIRTSGEVRTSNFLPWQAAYSEWYFTKTLWPAFTKREFLRIIADYGKRERRNGK
jgi:undecaprenyl diphosphate synthase